jgi:hypothetical protein
MKIRPAGAELYHEDGETDMTKLIFALRNFANAPEKAYLGKYHCIYHLI